MKSIKNIFRISEYLSFLLLIFGIVLVVKPDDTVTFISNLVGVILLIIGLSSIIKYVRFLNDIDIIFGVVITVLGLVLLLNPVAVLSILPFVLGCYILINGITKLRYAFDIKKYKGKDYTNILIMSILTIICGLVLIIRPFSGVTFVVRIIGIILIVYSIIDIINYHSIKKDIVIVERIFK